MKQFLLLFFTLIQLQAIAQSSLSFKLNDDSLKKLGVDTFFAYKSYCVGCVHGITISRNATKQEQQEKWCEASDPFFLYYKKGNKLYVTKFNDCYRFKSIQLDTSQAFSYFLKYFYELLSEKILPNSYISEKGEIFNVSIDHRVISEFYLSAMSNKELIIDHYDLAKTSISDKPNINYELNRNTKSFLFDKIIEEEIEKLEFQKY